MVKRSKPRNEFAKFFNSADYIALKNKLFNYRFRKYVLAKAYKRHSKKKDEIILDVGCGISPVSPKYSKTTFIDSDVKAIGLLKKAGYKALLGDVEKIPLKKGYADVIFSSEVLEHVPNYEKGLKEFNRVLKKDGLLFITVPTHMKYWAFDDDYVGHFRRFDPKKLAKEIEKEGFEILENRPIGSLLERELTKLIVKKVMKNGDGQMKIGKLKMKTFSLLNTFLFATIWLAYLFNNNKNSSIVLITAIKR